MSILLTVIAAILVLGPLVALHEWGHYIVARLCGVKVLTYSIGFGPKLLQWRSPKTDINYAISMIPLGGYVKMLDEREAAVKDDEKHLAFNNQKPWKKIAIVAAGPVMNLVIAVVLFWVLLMNPTTTLTTKIGDILPNSPASQSGLQIGDEIIAIDGKKVKHWQDVNYSLADRMGETGNIAIQVQKHDGKIQNYQVAVQHFMNDETGKPIDSLHSLGINTWQPKIAPIVGDLMADGVGKQQGLQVNDQIMSVNQQTIDHWLTFSQIIKDNPNKPLQTQILRDGNIIQLTLTPETKKDAMGNRFGQLGVSAKKTNIVIPDGYQKTIQYTPITALGQAIVKTYDFSIMTLKGMGKMITGLIGLDNLSGPITIAKVADQSFSIGWQAVLSFMAIISVSLAVLNLLPIPVLDGGHLVYYTIEAIQGKPVSEQVQAVGMNIGMIILASFMLLAIGNDISRLF